MRTLSVILLLLFISGIACAETVGIIFSADIPYYRSVHEAFVSRVKENQGGEKIKFIVQKPYPDPVSWSNAVRKLASADVDAIVTYGTAATLAAIKERTGIPVVYAGVYEPVNPKGRMTGACFKVPVSSILRYLGDITTVKTLGVLYSSMEEDSVHQMKEVKELSSKYGFAVREMNLRRPADVSALFSDGGELNALFLTSSASVHIALPSIVNIVRSKKIPSGGILVPEDSGVIVAFTADPKEQGRSAADKLMEVLKGKPAGDIPPSVCKNIELIFNMKEAVDMGLKIPMDLVTGATKIVY